jgi:hypothetical protein
MSVLLIVSGPPFLNVISLVFVELLILFLVKTGLFEICRLLVDLLLHLLGLNVSCLETVQISYASMALFAVLILLTYSYK